MLLILSESGSSSSGTVLGQSGLQSSAEWHVADLKTLRSEQRTWFPRGLRGLVLAGQDFFIAVVYPSDW